MAMGVQNTVGPHQCAVQAGRGDAELKVIIQDPFTCRCCLSVIGSTALATTKQPLSNPDHLLPSAVSITERYIQTTQTSSGQLGGSRRDWTAGSPHGPQN